MDELDPQIAALMDDLLEIDIEEECLHTLALYQPVAFDLRYVLSVLKINTVLERIDDLAVNIPGQACLPAMETPNAAVPPRKTARTPNPTKRKRDRKVRSSPLD